MISETNTEFQIFIDSADRNKCVYKSPLEFKIKLYDLGIKNIKNVKWIRLDGIVLPKYLIDDRFVILAIPELDNPLNLDTRQKNCSTFSPIVPKKIYDEWYSGNALTPIRIYSELLGEISSFTIKILDSRGYTIETDNCANIFLTFTVCVANATIIKL